MIHLDTSVRIHALVPASPADRLLRRWLGGGDHLAISAVAWAEVLRGPIGAVAVEAAAAIVGEIVPFAVADAEATASLCTLGGRRGGSLADCLVAAAALQAGATLATMNGRDFKRFAAAGLVIVEP